MPIPPRILFLDHAGVLGGAELSLCDIAAHFRATSRVALFEDGPLREVLASNGVDVQVVPAGRSVLSARRESGLRQACRSSAAIVGLLRRLGPLARNSDVLYANSLKSFVVAALLGRWLRRPVVWHLRDMLTAEHYSRANCRLTTRLARFCDARVIANSHATRDACLAAGGREDRVVTIHNGINPAVLDAITEHHARKCRADLGFAQDSFIVGVFSRLSPWKGQHVLLEAIAQTPDVVAVLVGDALFKEADYRDRLRAMVRELGLADRVRMLGFRRDVPQLMKACDVIAHTSVSPEPFGRVIVEGMLAHRPVVATNAGGATEIITSSNQGVLVPPGDSAALARAIACLQHDPVLRQRLALSGRRRAEEAFSVDRMLQEIEQELVGLFRQGRSARRQIQNAVPGKMTILGRPTTSADGSSRHG